MTTSLHEAFEDMARDVPALGDVDRAIRARQTRQLRIRTFVAVGAVAALVLLVVWGGGLLTSTRHLPPVVPRPTSHAWPSSVDLDPLPARTLATDPLPSGAAVAVVVQKPITGDGQVLIVAAGDQTRVVATGRMISPIALSPDGHLLAYATIGFGGDDFTVLDVTTGELLHDGPAQTSGGRPAETFNLDWSADSRRLFQLTAAMSDPEGPVEGRLWDTAAGTLSLAGSVDGLPGAFIGLSPDGTRIAAESGTVVAVSGTGSAAWVRTSLPVPARGDRLPNNPARLGAGQNRWSPDGRTLAWVVTDQVSSWFELVGLDGSTRIVRVPGPSSLAFDGWRGDEPVAERLSGDQSMDLIAISADGRVVVLSTITTGTTQALTSTVAVDWLQS